VHRTVLELDDERHVRAVAVFRRAHPPQQARRPEP
jgi:hypothetical protein